MKIKTIKPYRGRLLGKILPPEDKYKSIHLAKIKKEVPDRVKIISVGPLELDEKGFEIKPFASVGETVYIKRYVGDKLSIDGEDLIFLKNADIVGKA